MMIIISDIFKNSSTI